MSSPKSQSKSKIGPNYEELRAELDSVLAELQREDLDVDKALEYYQRGLELVRQLQKYLKSAENKVRDIKNAVV
ncbi:MAG TPA: exodeoxyribonuclease VII small subunit [Candidatus Saccharimonadales bacterium]|nr:exodeoxyribonuclease VII small subunit [Candidatus Saccharimonadales bacterium]